jgi:Family of unknown function (DUF6459)
VTAVLNEQTSSAATAAPAIRKVSVRPAPRREPPFDDEQPVRHLRAVGAHDQPLPFDPWPGRLSVKLPWAAPRPTSRGELPDPAVWARRLLVALLEARAGRRPVQQLAHHLSPSVQTGLTAELAHRATAVARRPAAVKSIRVCEPADGVAEVSAVIQAGARVRAIALRLEGLDGRWLCVRLQTG